MADRSEYHAQRYRENQPACPSCGGRMAMQATQCRECMHAADGEVTAELKLLAEDLNAHKAKVDLSRQRLYDAVRRAKANGMSFPQIRAATGLAVSSIQGIVEKR